MITVTTMMMSKKENPKLNDNGETPNEEKDAERDYKKEPQRLSREAEKS